MFSKMSKWVLVGFVVLACTVQLATAAVITVGQSGADYTSFSAAVSAVSGTDTTIRFIDSATYNEAGQPSITAAKYAGLTIESAPGQKATLNFTGSGGYGFLLGRANMTVQNMNLKTGSRTAVLESDGNATNAKIIGVNFSSTIGVGMSGYLLSTSPGMSISYSTFLGTDYSAAYYPRLNGVSWSANTMVTVNHCSFDKLTWAINNPSGTSGTTQITVTNSAFGTYYSSSGWSYGIMSGGGTGTENYDASYGPVQLADNVAITRGANSLRPGSYAGVFAGDTTSGDWTVAAALQHAASDGTAIGVPEPATLALLLMGGIVSLRNRRRQ